MLVLPICFCGITKMRLERTRLSVQSTQLQQAALNIVQVGFEYMHSFCNVSEQPVPVFVHPHCKKKYFFFLNLNCLSCNPIYICHLYSVHWVMLTKVTNSLITSGWRGPSKIILFFFTLSCQ